LNIIDAKFSFNSDGLIVTHVDTFDLWRWSRMALGCMGITLGWTSFVQNKIRKQAREVVFLVREGENNVV
jgi:hypothetical protein